MTAFAHVDRRSLALLLSAAGAQILVAAAILEMLAG